jgi:hypothetical protein
MIIVYGTRCFGRADAIEGLGHVSCRFVHIMFVPLVPIETIFMTDDGRGAKLPFSFKAAASGWLRGGALVTGIACVFAALANFSGGDLITGAATAVVAALSLASFPFWGLVFGRCSEQRRSELLAMLGGPGYAQPAPAPAPANAWGPQPGWGPQPVPQNGWGPPVPNGPMQPAGGFGQPVGYGYGAPMAAQGYAPPQGPPQGPGPMPGYGAPPYGGPPYGGRGY